MNPHSLARATTVAIRMIRRVKQGVSYDTAKDLAGGICALDAGINTSLTPISESRDAFVTLNVLVVTHGARPKARRTPPARQLQ